MYDSRGTYSVCHRITAKNYLCRHWFQNYFCANDAEIKDRITPWWITWTLGNVRFPVVSYNFRFSYTRTEVKSLLKTTKYIWLDSSVFRLFFKSNTLKFSSVCVVDANDGESIEFSFLNSFIVYILLDENYVVIYYSTEVIFTVSQQFFNTTSQEYDFIYGIIV